MKKKLLYPLLAALVLSLTGCKVWEEKWEEIRPLPEVETPVDHGDWDPDGGEGHEVGE